MYSSGTLVTGFALLAAVTWGLADFIWAKAAKDVGPVMAIALGTVVELPLMLIFYPIITGYLTARLSYLQA